MPLRLPGRVVSDIETLVNAVVDLQSDATRHLGSVDERAGELVQGLSTLQRSVDRIEGRVERLEQERMQAFSEDFARLQDSIDRIDSRVAGLEALEESLTDRLDGLRADLNERMIEVRQEVRGMRPAMDQMATDVKKIDDLLPDPSAGPMTRLKDTLSSS